MKIPGKDVEGFLDEIVGKCDVSRQGRITRALSNQAYFYAGSNDGGRAPYNRVRRHISRMSSYLYSPGNVRYAISFDRTTGEPWLARAAVAGRHLSREYRALALDLQFSQAVKQSLIRGCAFAKHLQGTQGPRIDVVWPEFMGVMREDLTDIDQQQAFVQTSWYMPDELHALLAANPNADALVKKAMASATTEDALEEKSYFHQIVIGGLNPVGPNPSGSGTVGISPIPGAQLDPMLAAELIRFDEIWIIDDEREDYTTFWRAGTDNIIEGQYKRRNLWGMKGEHGFVKVCSAPTDGYFWGEPEPEVLCELQDLLTSRVLDIKRILRMQGKPPKAFIGFAGMTQDKYNTLMRRGGFITSDMPNAKVEDLAPKLPEAAFSDVHEIMGLMDEQGGFKPIAQGEGEAGVRSGVHAQTLLRTASPELRERALIVERQAEDSGDLVFKMMQLSDAKVFVSEKQEQFLLSQMPDDYNTTVDSHSSSPAFADDEMQKAFALHKAGAISNEDLIEAVHPPQEDKLMAAAKERAKAQAEFMEKHPELAAKGRKR